MCMSPQRVDPARRHVNLCQGLKHTHSMARNSLHAQSRIRPATKSATGHCKWPASICEFVLSHKYRLVPVSSVGLRKIAPGNDTILSTPLLQTFLKNGIQNEAPFDNQIAARKCVHPQKGVEMVALGYTFFPLHLFETQHGIDQV